MFGGARKSPPSTSSSLARSLSHVLLLSFSAAIPSKQKMFKLAATFLALLGLALATSASAAEQNLRLSAESECAVADYYSKAGFSSSEVPVMVCIAKYESSWNCKATNQNSNGSTDYGLSQINNYYWCDSSYGYNECGTSCSALYDCQANANCARTVYKQQGYNAWYGYQSHKSECDNYTINC